MLKPYEKTDGSARRIGHELEFSNVSLAEAAHLLESIFQGEITKKHNNLISLETEDGAFTILVDFEYLQELSSNEAALKKDVFKNYAKTTLEDISEGIVPLEIVTPPLLPEQQDKIDALAKKLKEAGAQGTKDSLINAFGYHLNIDIPDLEAPTITRYLQSYCLLEPWLAKRVQRDITRGMSGYTKYYTTRFKKEILRENYAPSQSDIINTYLYHNPSRNRALDMLPIFAMIDEEKVRLATGGDTLVKKRPAFHYRLPNCALNVLSWTPSQELEHWSYVEKVANDDKLRAQLIRAWHDSLFMSFLNKTKMNKKINELLDI